MNKSEFIAKLAEDAGLKKADAEKFFDAFVSNVRLRRRIAPPRAASTPQRAKRSKLRLAKCRHSNPRNLSKTNSINKMNCQNPRRFGGDFVLLFRGKGTANRIGK